MSTQNQYEIKPSTLQIFNHTPDLTDAINIDSDHTQKESSSTKSSE